MKYVRKTGIKSAVTTPFHGWMRGRLEGHTWDVGLLICRNGLVLVYQFRVKQKTSNLTQTEAETVRMKASSSLPSNCHRIY